VKLIHNMHFHVGEMGEVKKKIEPQRTQSFFDCCAVGTVTNIRFSPCPLSPPW